MHKIVHRLPHVASIVAVLGSLLLVILAIPPQPALAAAVCATGAAAQNDISVEPSHGSVFYIDTGVTPVLDAGYIGYRVTNDTGASMNNLWAEVSGFTGTVLSLANPADENLHLPTLANGATGTAYFLFKATGATTAVQKHTLKVYENRPDLSNAVLLYECEFSFSRVKETIKAAANKVSNNGLATSAAIEVSDTSPEIGQTVVLSVEGQTGQIGAGGTPDFDILWFTPAAVSSWPTSALRLESMSVTFDGNGNWANTGDQVTYTNQLLISGANGLTNVDGSQYRVFYTFRVIGAPSSTVTVVPVAQIASGTQVKHSDTGATGGTLNISFSTASVNATLAKSVTDTTGLTVEDCTVSCSIPGAASDIYVAVPYRLTAASTTATSVSMDEFVDVPETEAIFKSGSATITDLDSTAEAIDDPGYVDSEELLDPRPNHFIGPFTFDSGTPAILDYEMWLPVGTFVNTAYALVGDTLIGATATAMQQCDVESVGDGDIGVICSTVQFGIVAITNSATDVTSSAATLNGSVDPNGATPLTGQFEYGTSPTLSGAATVNATTPASGTLDTLTDPTAVSLDLTGLTSGTTYYFRVVADDAMGEILSFTTAAVLAAPTATTTAASSVSTSGATLNGTINPNLTPVTAIQFVYGTVSDLSSGTTTVTLDDGSGTAELTAGGGSTQPFSKTVSGLSSGTTYYFMISACTASSGSYPSITCSASVDGEIMSFVASTPPEVTTDAATAVSEFGATLNGTVDANGLLAATSFEYGTVSDLSSGTSSVASDDVSGTSPTAISETVSALSSSTTYYFRAIAVNDIETVYGDILNFTTDASLLLARTHAIDAESYESTYSTTDTPPTITSTPSAGAGTKSYSSSTLSVCTIDEFTGVVTFVAAGTCTIGSTIDTDETYAPATAPSISFTVSVVSRTHEIDAESYDSSYVLTAAPPTLTSTPSAGSGTKTYTSTTTSVCTVDESTGVVSFVAVGTCTIYSDIAADGTYDDATSDSISFTIQAPSSPPNVSTPTGGAIDIAGGATCVVSDSVILLLSAANATHVSVANTAVEIGSSWQSMTSATVSMPWTLAPDDGTKTVYAQFQNGSQLSPIVSDSIVVDGATACQTVEPPPTVPPPTVPPPTEPPPTTPPTTPPTVPPGTVPPACDVSCNDVSYDLYIINPDGTERHTGTPYVRVTDLGGGRKLYGFEDSGRDFDHNDVQVVVDEHDCSNVRYEMLGVSARWHHQLIVNVFHKGDQKFNAIILPDTHAAVGYVKSVDAKNDPAMCIATPVAATPVCRTDGQFTTFLRYGSFGGIVLRLQQLLLCLDFFPAEILPNGNFGPATRASVVAFQIANGIDPLGIVGPLTRAALNFFAR